jgi:hypothetical protein
VAPLLNMIGIVGAVFSFEFQCFLPSFCATRKRVKIVCFFNYKCKSPIYIINTSLGSIIKSDLKNPTVARADR